MNKERARRLIKQGKMTAAGLAALENVLTSPTGRRLEVAPDILRALRRDRRVWMNFQRLPQAYKRIRLGWVEAARKRPKLFRQRLRYFLKNDGAEQAIRHGAVRTLGGGPGRSEDHIDHAY
jgi:hypothetical protein